MRLCFKDCVFDAETREVLRARKAVAISPKAFSLLELLIEARPRAVSKAELHERLWPGIHVSEANLPNLVAELRTALGDDSRNPAVIRTVARFGYAFSARPVPEPRNITALEESEGPLYRLVWGKREIALDAGDNLIGRDREAVIWIDEESVSRQHARIRIGEDGAVVEDLGSKNGTFVRDKKIRRATPLSDRDVVKIGRAELTFRILRHTGSTLSTTGKRPSR